RAAADVADVDALAAGQAGQARQLDLAAVVEVDVPATHLGEGGQGGDVQDGGVARGRVRAVGLEGAVGDVAGQVGQAQHGAVVDVQAGLVDVGQIRQGVGAARDV